MLCEDALDVDLTFYDDRTQILISVDDDDIWVILHSLYEDMLYLS